MTKPNLILRPLFILLFLTFPFSLWAADLDRFVGRYVGQAEDILAGETQERDLRTTIEKTEAGFGVSWSSVTYKESGATKTKSYSIDFVPSQRPHIFASAMKTNIFGKQVPLDPLQGEPFVWARFEGDTFSVFSLYINKEGEYEMQEFHRTLTQGGFDLVFRRVQNGLPQKEVRAFLARQD